MFEMIMFLTRVGRREVESATRNKTRKEINLAYFDF